MEDCVFCKIAKGKIPADILGQNKNCVSFLDVQPLATGHLLVIPREHYSDVLAAPEEVAGDLMKLAKRMAAALNSVLRPDGYTFGINHGKAAGQAVPHLHLHLVPRWHADGGKSIHGALMEMKSEAVPQIGQKIKDALESLPD